jgi:TPR repeat protein
VTYYKMAADQGHDGAHKALARMQTAGKAPAAAGTDVAVGELEELVAKGEPSAYARLGDLYAKGMGVPKDDGEALRWYGEGARRGDPRALFRVGEVYEQGRGVEIDAIEALGWYLVAAQTGYADARQRANALSARLDPDAVQAATQRADAWQRSHQSREARSESFSGA